MTTAKRKPITGKEASEKWMRSLRRIKRGIKSGNLDGSLGGLGEQAAGSGGCVTFVDAMDDWVARGSPDGKTRNQEPDTTEGEAHFDK